MNTTLALVTLWMLCARGRLLPLIVAMVALVVAVVALVNARTLKRRAEENARRLRMLK